MYGFKLAFPIQIAAARLQFRRFLQLHLRSHNPQFQWLQHNRDPNHSLKLKTPSVTKWEYKRTGDKTTYWNYFTFFIKLIFSSDSLRDWCSPSGRLWLSMSFSLFLSNLLISAWSSECLESRLNRKWLSCLSRSWTNS